MNNIFNLISKFNTLSDTQQYINLFFVCSAIIFFLSYTIGIMYDKPCNSLIGSFTLMIHHFIIFFIFYGFLAPISILWLMLIVLFFSFYSWSYTNNKCFLSNISNMLCKYNNGHIFHDLSFILFNKADKFMYKNRIKIYLLVILFILLRLYEHYILYKNNKNKDHSKKGKKNKNIIIQGHRGARAIYPENTLSAFKYTIENGINLLELDLQITKDNQIIIYHDKTINKDICNGPIKPIKSLTLKEIKQYDCGSKKNPEFPEQRVVPGEKIPTFIELIEFIRNNYKNKNIQMNIEIKTETSIDSDKEVYEFSKKLIDIIHKYNISNNVIIQSFDTRALQYVKEIDPNIKTSYLLEDKLDHIDNIIKISKRLGVKIISPDFNLIDKNFVKKMQDNGFEVLVWTVNDKDDVKKVIEYGVDGIISDDPLKMKNYIESL